MSTKTSLLFSIVLLLSISAISSATDYVWDNGAGTQVWGTASNWSPDIVPGTGSTQFARIRIPTGPVFNGQTASVYRIYLETAGNGTLTMNSGSLTTVNHIYAGSAAVDKATINMNGGAINIGGTFYVSNFTGSTADVNVSGGTITCKTLSMRLNGGIGKINITSTGTLVIDNTGATNVNNYIANGWIQAYDGAGTVSVDVNNINPGKTTITGSAPTKATLPSPANLATEVSTMTDLSWYGMIDATSHDVYFGTVSPGTFQTNTAALNFDVGTLASNTQYYWRIDEVTPTGTVTGDVWTFTTGTDTAIRPIPADAAVKVSVNSALRWTESLTAESHDIYFGTTSPPAFVINQTDPNSYTPGTLAFNTTYYWRIDERRGSDVFTGTVWSFTTEDPIKKGPYLIYPGNNSQMTVLWQLPITQSCTLDWGTDTTYSTGTTSTAEYGTDHQHKYTITGLTPATKYYYRVTTPSTVLTGSFRTAPAADAATVKFLAYGDTRTYPGSHAAVLGRINSVIEGDPAYQTVLLHSGDWSESADEPIWTNEFFNRTYPATPQAQANIPIMGCLGNHELNGQGVVLFDKYYPYTYPEPYGHYFSFDYGPVHIVSLDQESANLIAGSPQVIWLTNDLANSTKRWKIIVLHAPGWSAYGMGAHSNNSTVQSVIQPLCEQYGVQIVFAGHNHFYSRAVVNGVQHVTTGGGGAPTSNYHIDPTRPNIVTATEQTLEFCKVNVYTDSMVIEAVSSTGNIIDSFSLTSQEPELMFVQATDPQIGWAMCGNMDSLWASAISKTNVVNPAFMVVTGDLVNDRGNQAQVDLYKAGVAQLKPVIPIYQLPGNHDIGDSPDTTSYALWKTRFAYPADNNNPWYSFSYGNTLFICLDTMVLKSPINLPDKAAEQMSWLTSELQRTGFEKKIVFTHIPICMSSISEPNGTNNLPTSLRQELLSLFHTYGVNAVFSGHAHYNSYAHDGDLDMTATSSSGCSLGSPSTPAGFRIVTIYADHIEHYYRSLQSITGLKGDFNDDGIVDLKDVKLFSGHWLDSGIWP